MDKSKEEELPKIDLMHLYHAQSDESTTMKYKMSSSGETAQGDPEVLPDGERDLKSQQSEIQYEKREPSARSDKNPDAKQQPVIDPTRLKAQRVTSLSNKSNNLTDENPLKHMLDSPPPNKHARTRKHQVGIINEICSIN